MALRSILLRPGHKHARRNLESASIPSRQVQLGRFGPLPAVTPAPHQPDIAKATQPSGRCGDPVLALQLGLQAADGDRSGEPPPHLAGGVHRVPDEVDGGPGVGQQPARPAGPPVGLLIDGAQVLQQRPPHPAPGLRPAVALDPGVLSPLGRDRAGRVEEAAPVLLWLRIPNCTITAGKDGEVGAVRSVVSEVLVGKTELSYTYTQPVRAGDRTTSITELSRRGLSQRRRRSLSTP